jgi:hypothetical protein
MMPMVPQTMSEFLLQLLQRPLESLAMSLRVDFRRVEDSWRDTDRALRHSIVSEQSHRGEIIDKLLDSYDSLLLNWRNSTWGYWINAGVISVADLGFVSFVLIPGHIGSGRV